MKPSAILTFLFFLVGLLKQVEFDMHGFKKLGWNIVKLNFWFPGQLTRTILLTENPEKLRI